MEDIYLRMWSLLLDVAFHGIHFLNYPYVIGGRYIWDVWFLNAVWWF